MIDLLVVGGGAAGFFGAIRAAELHPGWRIVILERGKSVLGKVRVSGGGRCNVTHACWDPAELVEHYPRGKQELLGPFHQFACGDMVAWLKERGVPTKIEEDGRMFPTTDNSQTIIDCLTETASRSGVEVCPQTRVDKLSPPETASLPWRVKTSKGVYTTRNLLLAPGSSPGIWQQLEQIGHTVVPAVPSLFTFNCRDERIRGLQGLSVSGATVRIRSHGMESTGPLLITHWGFSGPAILRLSAWGARELHELGYQFSLLINWVSQSQEQLVAILKKTAVAHPQKQLHKHPLMDFPQRLWSRLVLTSGVEEGRRWGELGRKSFQKLADQLTASSFGIEGKSTFKEEFVTAGGVDLKEVDFRTFGSKLHPRLYFAGEVLNIDAVTGGFNFQAAWTGAYIAGTAV